jgi:hypothetical protein
MTNLELRDAIRATEAGTAEWGKLVSEACKCRSFPLSWLPRGVSWSEYTNHGHA